MRIDWVKIGLFVVDLLRKLFFAAGIARGRAELSQEQKEVADAYQKDVDEIARAGRGRSGRAAIKRLRERNGNTGADRS